MAPELHVESVPPQSARLLTDKLIQERVRRRLLDSKVSADEVIGTLVSQMRGDVLDLLDDRGALDLERAREAGLGHLIKKIHIARRCAPAWVGVKCKQPNSEKADGPIQHIDKGAQTQPADLVTTTFEFHSQQAAAARLCKVLGIARVATEQEHSSSRFVPYFRYALERAMADAEAIGLQVTREEIFDRLAEAEKHISGFDLRKLRSEVME